jgi:hypothetical protein
LSPDYTNWACTSAEPAKSGKTKRLRKPVFHNSDIPSISKLDQAKQIEKQHRSLSLPAQWMVKRRRRQLKDLFSLSTARIASRPRRRPHKVKMAIARLCGVARLHNPPALKAIEAAEASLPGVPQMAVFDTAFYAKLPPKSYLYPCLTNGISNGA